MASLSSPTHSFPPSFNRRPVLSQPVLESKLKPRPPPSSSSSSSKTNTNPENTNALTVPERGQRTLMKIEKLKQLESRERKEEVNRKIASKKAISVILRREATKALIEKKKGTHSKRLLPRTVLEALYERITALRWESALKACHNFVVVVVGFFFFFFFF
jgi:hypothetical protein